MPFYLTPVLAALLIIGMMFAIAILVGDDEEWTELCNRNNHSTDNER